MPVSLSPSDSSLAVLVDLIHQRTGQEFENSRLSLLTDKLAALIADRGFHSALDYYYFLKYDPQAEEEWLRVQTALAVNETYFWREYDQIQAAAEQLVPVLLRERPGQPVRIWHAACATGEEPYTLAIALQEGGWFARGDIQILATDFNKVALERARAAVYRGRSFRSIPPGILRRYFTPVEQDGYRLSDEISQRVLFNYMNLLDENAMSQMCGFDVIYCRNAFIYFSNLAIRQTVGWFEQALVPGGVLFVASAESLLQVTRRLELVEILNAFGYQKRAEEVRA